MHTTFVLFRGLASATAFVLIATSSMAQDTATVPQPSDSAPQPADARAVPNPHALLPPLEGGPDGSPTGRRGNPLPGTSTSIPTTNPATVSPLPDADGTFTRTENTGIEGQCDPVVSFGECPDIPNISADGTVIEPDALAGDAPVTPQ